MPSVSKKQQSAMCMALAARKGDIKVSELKGAALEIYKSDMTNKEIEEFTVLKEGMTNLYDYLCESIKQNVKEFMIIKPEFLHYRNDILDFLKAYNIIPISEYRKTLSLKEAKKLYKTHAKEDFYESLCEYMSSGDSIGFILCNYGNVKLIDIKDEIRNKYGKDDMKNVIHSSDSGLNVYRESKIYFGTDKV